MVAAILRWELGLFLGVLSALILYRLFTGQINTAGLLLHVDPVTKHSSLSPARIQLLMLSLGSAGYYLLQVIVDPTRLPDLPNQLLYVQGGSGATFLGLKGFWSLQAFRK